MGTCCLIMTKHIDTRQQNRITKTNKIKAINTTIIDKTIVNSSVQDKENTNAYRLFSFYQGINHCD